DENGLVGKGWSIDGLSAIGRCRKTRHQDGAPKSIAWNSEDRFCLDGQRLVVTRCTYGANLSTYRTDIDSGVLVIVIGADGNPDYFKVERKDGSVSYYGTAPSDSASDAKLNNSNGSTLIWALRKVQDSVGNSIWLLYANDAAGHRVIQIRYAYGSTGTLAGH